MTQRLIVRWVGRNPIDHIVARHQNDKENMILLFSLFGSLIGKPIKVLKTLLLCN